MQPCEQVKYYNDNTLLIVKLSGALRFTCTPYLERAFNKFDLANTKELLLDLSQAKYLDSTIMGTIAKFFLQGIVSAKTAESKPIIVYQEEDIKRLFNKIGFDQFFIFRKEDDRLQALEDAMIGFPREKEDLNALRNNILTAHQTLCRLQPKDSSYDDVVQSFKDR